jgi:hypothetical protein
MVEGPATAIGSAQLEWTVDTVIEVKCGESQRELC